MRKLQLSRGAARGVLAGGVALAGGILYIYFTLSDEVEMRYRAMVVGAEDYCNSQTGFGEKDACKEYSACYDASIRDVLPSNVLEQIMATNSNKEVPANVEKAVRDLELNCAKSSGILK